VISEKLSHSGKFLLSTANVNELCAEYNQKYSLLRAKATFMADGYANPADWDEALCRATACEVLARRIVHNLPVDRLESVMSTRFRYRESDGDVSAPTSCLETAIDQHCTVGHATRSLFSVCKADYTGIL
jgi:hypothetical protein